MHCICYRSHFCPHKTVTLSFHAMPMATNTKRQVFLSFLSCPFWFFIMPPPLHTHTQTLNGWTWTHPERWEQKKTSLCTTTIMTVSFWCSWEYYLSSTEYAWDNKKALDERKTTLLNERNEINGAHLKIHFSFSFETKCIFPVHFFLQMILPDCNRRGTLFLFL